MFDGYLLKELAIRVTETEPYNNSELFLFKKDISNHFGTTEIFKPLVHTIDLFKKYKIKRSTTGEYGITHAIDCLNITRNAGGLPDSCIMSLTHDNLEETFQHYLKEVSQLSMQIAYLRSLDRLYKDKSNFDSLENLLENNPNDRRKKLNQKIREIKEIETYLFFDQNNKMIKEYENLFENKPTFYSDQLKLLSYNSHIPPDILITPFDKKYNYALYKQYIYGIIDKVLEYQNEGNDNTCSLHAKISDRIHNSKTLFGLEPKQINNALEKDIILIDVMTEIIKKGLHIDITSKNLIQELYAVISNEMKKDYRNNEIYKKQYNKLNENADIGLRKIDNLFKISA